MPVVLPRSCPWHDDGRACDVRRHGERWRKCGPGHPLTVVGCKTHERHFTLYPPGWTPYGREPIAAPAGAKPATDTPSLLAAVARIAESPSLRSLPGYRRTHVRRIARAARWLGLSGDDGETIAGVLGQDLHAQVSGRRAYERSRTWLSRARVVSGVLTRTERSPSQLERLLVAGYRAGLCGRPWLIDPKTGALVPLARRRERACRPPSVGESGSSTTLPAEQARGDELQG